MTTVDQSLVSFQRVGEDYHALQFQVMVLQKGPLKSGHGLDKRKRNPIRLVGLAKCSTMLPGKESP